MHVMWSVISRKLSLSLFIAIRLIASSCEFHEFGSGGPGPGSQRPRTEGFEAVTCLTPE